MIRLDTLSKLSRDTATKTTDTGIKDDVLLLCSQVLETASDIPGIFMDAEISRDILADADKSVPTIASLKSK